MSFQPDGGDSATSTAAPTAIIADDEPLLRAGLKAALAEAWPELAKGEVATRLAARIAAHLKGAA